MRWFVLPMLAGLLVGSRAGLADEAPPPAPPGAAERVLPEWAKVSKEQLAEADRLKVPVAIEEPTTGMGFVLIPGGAFTMGTPEGQGDYDERPQHEVTLSPFYLSIAEVTNAQYLRFDARHESTTQGHERPVGEVTWDQATGFATWVSGLRPGPAFTLPTEAQWEFACRAGSTTVWSFGDDASKSSAYAWTRENARAALHGVAARQPNSWGLYDMHGNVGELCQDAYVDTFYTRKEASQRDPVATVSAPGAEAGFHVSRGGSFMGDALSARSANRERNDVSARSEELGYRGGNPSGNVSKNVRSSAA